MDQAQTQKRQLKLLLFPHVLTHIMGLERFYDGLSV